MNPHRGRTDVDWTALTPRSRKRKKMAVASLRSKKVHLQPQMETVISAAEAEKVKRIKSHLPKRVELLHHYALILTLLRDRKQKEFQRL